MMMTKPEERQSGDIVTVKIEYLLVQLNDERIRMMGDIKKLREELEAIRDATVWTRIWWVFKGVE